MVVGPESICPTRSLYPARLFGQPESVTHTAHRGEVHRGIGVIFDDLAQPAHVNVQGTSVIQIISVPLPDLLDEVMPAECLAGVAHEHFEQPGLHRRQPIIGRTFADVTVLDVKLQVAQLEHIAILLRQQPRHAVNELARRKRPGKRDHSLRPVCRARSALGQQDEDRQISIAQVAA